MKQTILNLKNKLLLVELPEGADRIKVFHDTCGPYISYFIKGVNTDRFYLDKDVRVFGKLTDIKQHEFCHFVSMHKVSNDHWRYANYNNLSGQWFDTAKESFFSYLKSGGVYFENQLGEKPVLDKEDLWGNAEQDTQVFAALNYQTDKWQEAEEKVWDINRCYLFQII